MLFFLKRLIKFNLIFNGRPFPTLPLPNNIRYDLKEVTKRVLPLPFTDHLWMGADCEFAVRVVFIYLYEFI